MIQSVFMWVGAGRYSHSFPVDDLFHLRYLKAVVVDCLVTKEYLEVLQLMHGKEINIMTLWDWSDHVWDRIHDRGLNTALSNEMYMVASNRTDLCEILPRHMEIERLRDKALESYERRNDPPIQFTGSFKELFI